MNKTEEIVKEYDRKRSVVHRLRYAERISLLLMFYTYFRFATGTPGIFKFCFACAFLTIFVKQVYLFSLYGIGTTRRGKELPAFKLRIVVLGVLIELLLVEVVSLIMANLSLWNITSDFDTLIDAKSVIDKERDTVANTVHMSCLAQIVNQKS